MHREEKDVMKQQFIRNLNFIIRTIWKLNKKYVVFNVLYSFENIPRRLLNIMIIQYMVDAAVMGGDFNSICVVGIAYLFYNILMIIFRYWFDKVYKVTQEEYMKKCIKKELYLKAIRFDIGVYDDAHFYDTYIKAFSVVDQKSFEIFNQLIKLLGMILSIGTLFSVIMVLSPVVVGLAVTGCVLSMIMSHKLGTLAYEKEKELTPYQRRLNYIDHIIFGKQYSKDVRTENIHEILFGDYDATSDNKIKILQKNEKKESLYLIFQAIPTEAADVFMWIYIAGQIITGELAAGSFMALSNAAWSITNQLRGAFNAVLKLYRESLFINNIREFSEYQAKIENCTEGISVDKGSIRSLKLEHCSFSYENKQKLVLEEISILIQKGQQLAIVGHNGAGKSTLVKLILRLYDPVSGILRLNGIPYQQYQIQELRKCFAVVFQDYQYYAYTIAQNILMKKDITVEDKVYAEEILKKVGLYDKVISFPKGVDTEMTREFDQDGVVFSGGELQRLAIARAIAKNTPVIILDEPSSALDPIAEAEIGDLFIELFREKIVIMISHKLSMTRHCDHILLIENGKVCEMGNHTELIARQGMYTKMWYAQSKKYKEGV